MRTCRQKIVNRLAEWRNRPLRHLLFIFTFFLSVACYIVVYKQYSYKKTTPNFETWLRSKIFVEDFEIRLRPPAYAEFQKEIEFIGNVPANKIGSIFYALSFKVGFALMVLDKKLLLCAENASLCRVLQTARANYTLAYRKGKKSVVWNAVEHFDKMLAKVISFNDSIIISPIEQSGVNIFVLPIEERKNYWSIGGDPSINQDHFLIDVPDELENAKLFEFQGLDVRFIVPKPARRMRMALDRSRFLDCDYRLAKSFPEKYPKYYLKIPVINDEIIDSVDYLRRLLETIDIHIFLYCGTMLGWYRECGIIRYTTDVDVAFFANEYTDAIESVLKKDQRLRLHWRLGKSSTAKDEKYDFSAIFQRFIFRMMLVVATFFHFRRPH